MKLFNALKKKREVILELAARHGASNVRVFGSAACGEESENSDVDFLVDMQEGGSLYDLIALQQDLERILGRKADVLTPGSINRYLKDRILGEARPL